MTFHAFQRMAYINTVNIPTMAKCELIICKKKPMRVTRRKLLRGNYNPTSKYTQSPNVQWYTMPDGTRIKACTSCIRTMNKAEQAA